MARRYTIESVQLAKQHTRYILILTVAGRQWASEEGWMVGGRGQVDEGGEGPSGGREEAMMLGRERASVEEGRVEGGWVDEGNERGRDGTRHGQRVGKRGGRKRAEEGLSVEAREKGRKGTKGGKETSREVSRGGHWPVYNIFTNHPTTRHLALTLWYYKWKIVNRYNL